MAITDLFEQELKVVCAGLPVFYKELVKNDVPAINVDASVADNHDKQESDGE